MELILISNSKLKIMLSAEDMKKYNIECDGGSALRQGFKPVLERAHDDCGFDIESGRLLVQVFPSRGGGCEMFVTRIALTGSDGATDASVCIFDCLGAMISLCRVLHTRGLGKKSEAYALPEGSFALILPEFDRDERLPLEAAVINEFGYRRDCEKIEGYIKEHSRAIFTENAVARLAELA
jgi:negative regulator of genetic competence, sporulation and motility